jgi:hypothetical protein
MNGMLINGTVVVDGAVGATDRLSAPLGTIHGR